MRNLVNSVLALFGAAAVTSASDVHDLKLDTFEPFVQKHDLVLAEFFAPWCGHCKALAPEYEEAASTLKEKNIPLVKVDCTEEADLCQKYGVEGYPTVKVFRGPDVFTSYTGQRKAQAIVSYMIKQSLPAVSILDKSSLDEFKKAENVVLVAYLSADDKSSNETFTAVADSLREKYLFGATNDESLAKAEGVKMPAVVLYKQYDEGKNTFTEKFDKEKLESFVKTASVPLVGEVGPETYGDYMASGLPLAYIFAEEAAERAELAKTLRPIAEKYKGKINFATIDAKAFGAHAGNLNLETEKFPAFAIQETVKNQKFPFDQSKKLTEKDVGKFVQDMLDGKIEPSVKSEPVPEKQDGPVHVVVARNYQEIVMDNDKDVLLEFYAPWCGHCKALAPKYEELAAMYFNNPDHSKKVVVAKVDATANDVPDEIAGFPTIKLFPAGGKGEPIEYSGSRTVEDLATFIKENGKHQVDANISTADEDVPMPDADKMGRQAAAASQKAGDAKEQVKMKAGDASDAAKDKASSATDKAADATEAAKDKAGKAADKAGDAKDAAKDKASSATEKAADATGAAKNKASSATEKAGEAASKATEKAGDATDAAKDKAAKATDKAGEAKDAVKDQAGKATDKAGDAKDTATEKAGEAKDDIKGKVKSKISEAAEAVKTAVADDEEAEIHVEL